MTVNVSNNIEERLESNPEIESMLNALRKIMKADGAILYKYIDIVDIEATEILDELLKSKMLDNNKEEMNTKHPKIETHSLNFFSRVIKKSFLKEVVKYFSEYKYNNTQSNCIIKESGLEILINKYKSGQIDLNNRVIRNALEELRKKIRVLRFCEVSENPQVNKRWNFSYAKRPKKYLVFDEDILEPEFNEFAIDKEGVTSFFCRVKNISNRNLSPIPLNNEKSNIHNTGHMLFSSISHFEPLRLINIDSLYLIIEKLKKEKELPLNSLFIISKIPDRLEFLFTASEKHSDEVKKLEKTDINNILKNISIPDKYRIINNTTYRNIIDKQMISSFDTNNLCIEYVDKYKPILKTKEIISKLIKGDRINCEDIFGTYWKDHSSHFLFMSKSTIDQCNAHSSSQLYKDIIDRPSNHHAAWILLEKEDGNIVGCLRFEYYKKEQDLTQKELFELTKTLRKMANRILINTIISLLDNINIRQRAYGYEEKYQCLNHLLEKLKSIDAALRGAKYTLKFNRLFLRIMAKNTKKLDKLIENKRLSKDITHRNDNDILEIIDILFPKEEFKKLNINMGLVKHYNLFSDTLNLFIDSYYNYEFTPDQINRKSETIINNLINKINLELDEVIRLNTIHYLIVHLFYVFKRNTYHGDVITKRINKFIEDLLDSLNLPKDAFSKVWDDLKRHEDLMLYNIENYRDHLMHQFHVFIIGYIIIYNFDINKICQSLTYNYRGILNLSQNPLLFSKLDVLRIWSLTSLFHDCGYAFEKLSRNINDFSTHNIGIPIETHFSWGKSIFSSESVINILKIISKYYIKCNYHDTNLSEIDLFQIFLKSVIINNDHGVISALILMQNHLNHETGYSIPHIEAIMNIAAVAIALHNKTVYKNLHDSEQIICLHKNPMAFILNYCDTSQEFSRKKIQYADQEVAPPILSNIFIDKGNTHCHGEPLKFNIILYYPPDAEGLRPTNNYIIDKTNPISDTFLSYSENYFSIFYNIRDSRVDSHTLKYHRCENSKCLQNSENTNY